MAFRRLEQVRRAFPTVRLPEGAARRKTHLAGDRQRHRRLGTGGGFVPYVVLQACLGPNVSVVSAFLGALMLLALAKTHGHRWMNNIVQTAGTSAAQTAFMCRHRRLPP